MFRNVAVLAKDYGIKAIVKTKSLAKTVVPLLVDCQRCRNLINYVTLPKLSDMSVSLYCDKFGNIF